MLGPVGDIGRRPDVPISNMWSAIMNRRDALTFGAATWLILVSGAAAIAQAPNMKMTTDIPPSLVTPDTVETRIGTLRFKDGFPDDATAAKVYENLDFQRGVPGLSRRIARRFD
jgi:hypothetical protein